MLTFGALSRRPGGIDPRALEFAVVDTETTGMAPEAGDRVCEIAVVRMRGDGAVLDEYTTLVNPGRPIANAVYHGIRDADVADAPVFGEVAGDLLALLSGAVVVGHNLAYDARFIGAELARLGIRPAGVPGLCTLVTARSQLDLRGYRLAEVVTALTGRRPTGLHRALDDSRACARVLAELAGAAPCPLGYFGPPPVPVGAPYGRPTGRVKPRAAAGCEAAGPGRPTHPLRGCRLLAVGDDPAVAELMAWASTHGAAAAVRPDPSVTLVVAPEASDDPRVAAARAGGVPVCPPADARVLLTAMLEAAPGSAPGAARRAPACGSPRKGVPEWHAFWRPVELPPARCRGRFGPRERAAAVRAARRRARLGRLWWLRRLITPWRRRRPSPACRPPR